MATWYLGKIAYQKENQTGGLQTYNEAYLVDAVSYTEAEGILFKKVQDNTPDFKLKGLTKMKLSEVFIQESGDMYFKMRVLYVTFDERTQKEKNVPHTMLINAENPRVAYDHLVEKLGGLNDYKITDINTIDIQEIFEHEKK